MNLTLLVYFDVKYVEKNVFLSFSSIWNTWKFWPNRELVVHPALTQSSALDLLREDFHSTLNHVSVSHPPQQPNPQHSHFYNPQPNNPAIDLPPTVEKSFFSSYQSHSGFLFLISLFDEYSFSFDHVPIDEILRVQIIPLIVTIKLLFI